MKNPYEVRGDVTAIFLRHRDWTVHEGIIDSTDLDKAMAYDGTWTAHWCDKTQNYYVEGYNSLSTTCRRYQNIKMHRWLLNPSSDLVVDHINHDTLDNRRCNLRVLTSAENMQSKRLYKNNTSGYRGLRYRPESDTWVARVDASGEHYHIGVFDSLDKALDAVREARARLLPFSTDALINR